MPRLLTPPDLDDASFAAAMKPVGEIALGPARIVITTYLDTFDWRLFNVGMVLTEELAGGRRLCLLDNDAAPYATPAEARPTIAETLPAGHLADRIGRALGVRSLLPVGATRIVRRDGRIEDRNGNLVARLRLDEVTVIDSRGGPAGQAVTTVWIDHSAAAAMLERIAGVSVIAGHDLVTAAAAWGRTPGDYSSKLRIQLDPEEHADRALRAILLDLLSTIEINTDGAIADHDSEFVHDLRVACRRSRSALTQVKGVLEPELTAPANAELKWLGKVTNPLRDLDVYLLEMPSYRSLVPPDAAADLAPVESSLRRSRARAHRAVVRALRSTRFSAFTAGWRAALMTDAPAPGPEAQRPVVELAADRVDRAYRRILKHGLRLGDDPSATALHQIRIDAKKLRYLLEFFASLFPARDVADRVGDLKRLQDILGGVNDMQVQRRRLTELAEELRPEPSVGTGCLLALGRLAGALEARQDGFRHDFHNAFADFASKPVRHAFEQLTRVRRQT
jgi:CHAD domain-containing protein